MPAPTFKCPACGAVVPNEYKAGQPLTCSECSQQLQLAKWYLNVAFVTAVGLTIVLCTLLGFRGLWLFLATITLLLPVNFAWMFLYVRIVPPRFEPYRRKDSG
jgi:endogenous inhibitor of DNA gyrase (YacG/DUF329 family)